jgi:hypothetical protein
MGPMMADYLVDQMECRLVKYLVHQMERTMVNHWGGRLGSDWASESVSLMVHYSACHLALQMALLMDQMMVLHYESLWAESLVISMDGRLV